MRVLVLTSRRSGFASVALPPLAESGDVDVAGIVFNEGRPVSRGRRLRRDLRKVRRIGVLGALNGIRMRRWYGRDTRRWIDPEPMDRLADRYGIPFHTTDRIGSDTTVRLFEQLDADLGLSLGNGYIPSRVFTVPRFGMVNVHHELLPEFRGAASVVWQIHEGSDRTGFSIHQIDRSIDTGAILYREAFPIDFRPSLAETVSWNYARLWRESAARLPDVVTRYETLASTAEPQGPGRSFTTPTIVEFGRMLRNHRALRKGTTA